MSSTLHAATVYITQMNGANERPNPILTGATGTSTVTLSDDQETLSVEVLWSGLTAPAAAAHIHCCIDPSGTAPVAVGFPGFPATVSGSYTMDFDLTELSTYGAAYLTLFNLTDADQARNRLILGLNSFETYTNIHNMPNPGGEIRGQLAQIPEPGTAALLIGGLAACFMRAQRRKRVG
jgi:hypothetical protein